MEALEVSSGKEARKTLYANNCERMKGVCRMKTIIALGLILALLCPLAGAETFPVSLNFDARAMADDAPDGLEHWPDMRVAHLLVSTEDGLLVPGLQYESIQCISRKDCPAERKLFCATSEWDEQNTYWDAVPNTRYALMNAKGEVLTKQIYQSLRHEWECGVVIAQKEGLYGLLDETGKEMLEFNYGCILPDGNGGYFLTPSELSSENDGFVTCMLCHLDADGPRIISDIRVSMDFTPYSNFRNSQKYVDDGLLPVYFEDEQRRGYVNTACQVVISPIYTFADPFENGVAAASIDGKKIGILRTDGTWALEPVYDSIAFDWNLYDTFSATRDGKKVFIDRETFEETENNENDESVYAVNPNKLVDDRTGWGSFGQAYLRNPSGEVVAGPYNSVHCAYWEAGQGSFMVDAGGELLFHVLAETPEGETISYVVAGTDAPQAETTDKDGNTIVNVFGGLEGYRCGIINQDGDEVVPLIYEDMQFLGNGWYFAKKEGAWGLLTEDGSWTRVCDSAGQAWKE